MHGIRKAPLPSDREKIMAQGWIASRDALGTALVAAYQPGAGEARQHGCEDVSRLDVFVEMERSLVTKSTARSRTASRETPHVAAQDHRIIFFGPGDDPHFDHNPPLEEVNQILSDQNTGAQLLRQLLPADLADAPDKAIAESLDPGVIAEWINDEELSRLLFENVSDHDYFPGVLTRLQEIYLRNRQKFKEYRGWRSHSRSHMIKAFLDFGLTAKSSPSGSRSRSCRSQNVSHSGWKAMSQALFCSICVSLVQTTLSLLSMRRCPLRNLHGQGRTSDINAPTSPRHSMP